MFLPVGKIQRLRIRESFGGDQCCVACIVWVSSTGGCGGEASPTNPPISNNKNSGFMFFRALVIDTQKNFACASHTIDLCTQSSPTNKQKILDETLIVV